VLNYYTTKAGKMQSAESTKINENYRK